MLHNFKPFTKIYHFFVTNISQLLFRLGPNDASNIIIKVYLHNYIRIGIVASSRTKFVIIKTRWPGLINSARGWLINDKRHHRYIERRLWRRRRRRCPHKMASNFFPRQNACNARAVKQGVPKHHIVPSRGKSYLRRCLSCLPRKRS